jgi:hypothetical protein
MRLFRQERCFALLQARARHITGNALSAVELRQATGNLRSDDILFLSQQLFFFVKQPDGSLHVFFGGLARAALYLPLDQLLGFRLKMNRHHATPWPQELNSASVYHNSLAATLSDFLSVGTFRFRSCVPCQTSTWSHSVLPSTVPPPVPESGILILEFCFCLGFSVSDLEFPF